jgi:4a-hydroxytetrahydrobiopterin dehydratase
VSLADFGAALAALNALAEVAEEQNHHPDLGISDYCQLTVSLTTHDAGGLTANDFVVARQAEGVLAAGA